MNKEEIKKLVRDEMDKELPKRFGRSWVQIKTFFINNIK